jgi:hypothetical protein
MSHLDAPTWFTIGGLALDVVGVSLIWRFGLPENVKRGGVSYYELEQNDSAEAAKAARYDRISAIALGLIIGGFVWQIVGILAK